MKRNQKVIVSGLVFLLLSGNPIANSYERPAVRPIPDEILSSRYNLTVERIRTNSGEAEKLAFIKSGLVLGISRTKGLVSKYYLNDDKVLKLQNLGQVLLPSTLTGLEILRIENSKFYKNYLYTAITTKPDADKCNYLVLVRQKYTSTGSLEPASRVFQSDCDRSKNDTWGGGITFNASQLYLSVGENRISYKTALPFTDSYTSFQLEKKNTYFGKVISINLNNFKEIKIMSIGHRNPAALFYDLKSSTLFESEFGPEGGDEINVIKRGKDYGYPQSSFGRIYDEKNPGIKSKFTIKYENYSKYEIPLMAYVPSVNPLQLFIISSTSEFKDWRGNLFVGCLSGKILRIVLNDKEFSGSVILSEELEFGARIRDFTEISSSHLLAATDDGEIVLLGIQN